MALLSVKDLCAYYRTEVYGISRTVRAVDGVTFDLYPNEIYGVAGESSCGKTTLIKVISGNIRPPLKAYSGSVDYQFDSYHVDMLKISQDEMRLNVRWKEISYVMQGSMSVLNPVRKVIKTFEDIVETHQPIKDRKEFLDQITEHVNRLGLPPEVLDAYPHQLSGGQRQRVMIAMALANEPDLLIADEPTTALDVTVQAQILELLKELTRETGSALILITHDLGVVARYADRVCVMYGGKVIETASAQDLYARPMHPYTRGLMASIPRLDQPAGLRLVPIKGQPPNLAQLPQGCAFNPRCNEVADRCRRDVPGLMKADDKHLHACWMAPHV